MLESQLAVCDLDEPHRCGKPHPGGACRAGIKKIGPSIHPEKRNVRMAIDDDLSRTLLEKAYSFPVKSKPRYCYM